MAYRTLLLLSAVASLTAPSGCSALGPMVGLGVPTAPNVPAAGPTANPVPGVLEDAGDSIFRVVAWGFAVIIGALALAFAAKLLNGRQRPAPNPLPPTAPPEVRT